MTPEELLKPRYKVIALWPNSKDTRVGAIMVFDNGIQAYLGGNATFFSPLVMINEVKKYPHLFKKLDWWEDRELADLPEYVCWSESKNREITKVVSWDNHPAYGNYCYTVESSGFKNIPGECKLMPATEQEYNDFKQPL